jgi:hypothetical protein
LQAAWLLSDVCWRLVESSQTARIPDIDVNSNGTLLSDSNVDRLLRFQSISRMHPH